MGFLTAGNIICTRAANSDRLLDTIRMVFYLMDNPIFPIVISFRDWKTRILGTSHEKGKTGMCRDFGKGGWKERYGKTWTDGAAID